MASLLYLAVHFLFLTCWLTQQGTGQATLGMANNAFDDQYVGCTAEMEKKAPRLLMKELRVNKNLKTAWEKAKETWKQIKKGISHPKKFNDFHGTALVAYTGSLAKEFNKAVREFHQNSQTFQFKAFHYYLTRALQLLSTGKCYKVYRGSHTKFYYSGKGNVRFGQFTSSSFFRNVVVSPPFLTGDGTLFVITSCLGIPIKAFSIYPQEEEVLIPGYEVYQKVTVRQTAKKYNEIWLENPKKSRSNFNCFYHHAIKNLRQRDSNSNSSAIDSELSHGGILNLDQA